LSRHSIFDHAILEGAKFTYLLGVLDGERAGALDHARMFVSPAHDAFLRGEWKHPAMSYAKTRHRVLNGVRRIKSARTL